MRNYLLPTALFGLIASGTLCAIAIVSYASPAVALTPVEIQRIAKQSTVQITTGCAVGSGVIIRKDGNTYTVLTVAHTFRKKESCSPLEVVAPDTSKYQIAQVKNFPNSVDLAAFTFTSSKSYAVAKLIDNSDRIEGMETIYVSGFPLSTAIKKATFVIVKGDVVANPINTEQGNGYSLIYSNNTLPGHSGGPVWNDKGEVIAIHGQGDIDSKSQETINNDVRVKTGYNLGITVNTFTKFAATAGISGYTPVVIIAKPKPVDELIASAKLKGRKADYKGMLSDMNQAIALDPQNSLAYYLRGSIKDRLYGVRDDKGALEDYNRAIALNPNYADAYYYRGSVKSSLGDNKGAIEDISRSLALNPLQGSLIHRILAGLKAKVGDYKGAIRVYDRSIALNPDYFDYNLRGLAKSAVGDKQGAIADFYRSGVLSSNVNPSTPFMISAKRQALKAFDRAIAIDPNYADAYYERGTAELALDKLDPSKGFTSLSGIADLRQAAKLYKQQGQTAKYQKVIAEIKRLGV